MNPKSPISPALYICWILSLAAFVIAAGAGVLFRQGMLDGFAAGFAPHHIRHAHSHLMLMGWTTPALMTLMATLWPRFGARPFTKSAVAAIVVSWLLAMSTFLPFLHHGYGRVDIGSASLPLAAILSGLAMFGWYAFALVYALATRRVPRTTALRLFDIATLFLVVSSFGAWGIGALMIKGVDSPFWSAFMLHFFVDLFGEGWLILGVLGLIHAFHPTPNKLARRATCLLAIGLVPLFLLGMPSNLLHPVMQLTASLGALSAAIGLAIHLRTLSFLLAPGTSWIWKLLWILLAAKTAALLLATAPPLVDWAKASGLRLLYLHLGFLGIATLALIAAARTHFGPRAFTAPAPFAASVLLMLAGLLPLTGLLPPALSGRWPFHLALILAIPPTLLSTYALALSLSPPLAPPLAPPLSDVRCPMSDST